MWRAQGLFVTGTDTGVGKTEIACALLRIASRMGWRTIGMKPVAAGARRIRERWRNADATALADASTVRAPDRLRNPYLLRSPIAPHIAARAAGIELQIGTIVRAYHELARRADWIVVEGAGGFCVPLNAHAHMGDLAAHLRLPIVLVVGMRLGCISHALLTAEAIARRRLELAGWVANRIDPSMRYYRDNVASIAARIDAPLWGEVPFVAARRVRRLTIERALKPARLAPRLTPEALAVTDRT
ncbi:MAG: dethiobiotin synthase [Burkholderiales bacterium]|nr:dethiobiotin synthase [Burkholderiales bacterium]